MLDIPIERGATIRVTASLDQAEAIKGFEASGVRPATPRIASTVLLVKPDMSSSCGKKVFMMRRAKTMAFVPDAVVFPGGGSAPEDVHDSIDILGPDFDEWACVLGVSAMTAKAALVAAVRELFEETGVLLAGDASSLVRTVAAERKWEDARKRLEAHETTLSEVLRSNGLAVRGDLLFVRSHWMTPEFSQKRYDTFFFSAIMHEDQMLHCRTSESVRSGWADPNALIEEGLRGAVKLVPPTVYNLKCCAKASLDELERNARAASKIMLKPFPDGNGGYELRCEIP